MLNVHEYQGADLMGKMGVNVPPGIAVKSLEEAVAAASKMADAEGEVVVKSQVCACCNPVSENHVLRELAASVLVNTCRSAEGAA